MAQSAAVAGAVVGVADVVGWAGIQTGHPESGRDPPTRPSTSDAMARRDAPGLGIARQSSRCVGRGGGVGPKRDRESTRLDFSHGVISYDGFFLGQKNDERRSNTI